MRILVTGASGYVGSALVAHLARENNFHISASYRSIPAITSPGVEALAIDDIFSLAEREDILSRTDVLVHLAGKAHIPQSNIDFLRECYRVNVLGAEKLASAAAICGVRRFVFLSSIKVYGEETLPGQAFTEKSKLEPCDFYARFKRDAEDKIRKITQSTGMEYVFLQPSLIFGPGAKGNLASLTRLVSTGIPLPWPNVDNRRSLLTLNNLMSAIRLCLQSPGATNRTFVLADDEVWSTRQVLEIVSSAMGKNQIFVPVPLRLFSAAAKMMGKKEALCKLFGITGQDGAYLAEFLMAKGYEVHGLKRRSSLLNTERIDHLYDGLRSGQGQLILHHGDMTDSCSLLRIIQEVRPQEVYNLAAQSHVAVSFEEPEYTANSDALGSLRLLEAIRIAGLAETTRYYQASTSELYGKVQQVPQTEQTPFYPRSPYAVAKLYAYWITVNYREAYNMYACNGILFNHESPLRGETFVTRKITRALCRIASGFAKCLHLGNLDAKRDWGHARDYVEMQYLMLQQDNPEDFVIATGIQYSVRDFVNAAAGKLGITLEWKGEGVEERGIVSAVERSMLLNHDASRYVQPGDEIIAVDPKFFRPAEVETLLGDATKAKEKLGWVPKIGFADLVDEMMRTDMAEVQRDALCQENGLLLQKGYRVVGTSRDADRCPFDNLQKLGVADEIQKESMSMADFHSVHRTLKRIRPEEVYNLAGQSSVGLSFSQPMETYESISVGTLNLLEAIRLLDLPLRFYSACSSDCFGNLAGERATEQTPFRPRSPYGVAKAAAFWQLANYREAYGLFACSGLLFNHESPLRPARFVTQKIVREACNIKIGRQKKMNLGDISIVRDWGWAPEYVEAMWLMLQRERADDFIIATGKSNSLEELVAAVFSTLGLVWQDHVESHADLMRPTDIQVSRANPEKAEKLLGWKARYSMHHVVEKMVEAAFEEAKVGCPSPLQVVQPGDEIIAVDPKFFRPAEVETLLGDATKAKEKLGWVPKI
ncbi:unnamed protein product, partial [Cyprideis torosa]